MNNLEQSRKSSGWFKLGLTIIAFAAIAFLVFQRTSRKPLSDATALVEVARTNLVLTNGRLALVGHTNAFSGQMIEHYHDGSVRSRSEVVNGLLQGLSQGWHTNGQLQVTEYFKNGVSDGLRTKWYESGAKQSEAHIVDGKLNGSYRKWHENGTLSEEANFVLGQPEGVSVAYYPSGNLKARVELKEGKPVDQKFWPDEAKQN